MHGVRGEVKVYPTTDDVKRFEDLKKCYAVLKGREVKLTPCGVKYFKNMVILKFKEYDNINDIEFLKGADLMIDREDAVPLAEGEYFICDILGFDAFYEDGERLGVLDDVLETGANDVFQFKTDDGKEILLPFMPEYIGSIDTEKKTVTVKR